MSFSLQHTKAVLTLLALLGAAVSPATLEAANFLFSWNAGADPSIAAYGIYQRTGSSAYERVGQVRVRELADPARPSYLMTGLNDGATYWFAATAILSTGAESELFGQTCITVDGDVLQCRDDEDTTASVYISCFISAAGGDFFRKTARR
ncbi:MAG: hypothetical protein MUD16_12345 [Desulfobacterales bacterium]|jgi:hypothetical protein|nr:hypothetical protein [Desulfobacterales bacterium]